MVLSFGLNSMQNKEEVFSVKKSKILGLLAIPALLLTGCVDSMPNLTREQSEMISEYAATLLLKYSPNYNYRIVDEEIIAQAAILEQESETLTQEVLPDETAQDIATEMEVEEETQNSKQEAETEVSTEIVEEVQVNDIDTDIAQLFAMEGITIKYKSYEICDSYPKNNEGFVVDAATDKKLLVVFFEAENVSGQAFECNLIGETFNVLLKLNGNKVTLLNTMLPNELATYLDTIEADKTQELVVVAEIDAITDDEVNDLMFEISNNSGEYIFKLK